MFFHDVPEEMGGTLFVPGSHFRRIRERSARRYHYIRGQQQTVCTAGTVVIWHHNVFHAARSNATEDMRYMFKVRLNPRVKQIRLWDCRDLQDPVVLQWLGKFQPWMGGEARTELINRIRLWRSLTAQPQFDIQSYLGRIESNF
jgi:hypothetical protein